MSAPLAANLVGLAGFLVLLVAPLARSRAAFLGLDVLGLIPVATHYVMLGSTTGAAFCVLYITMDIIGHFAVEGPRARAAYWLVYPVAAGILAVTWAGPGDLLAAAGTALAAAARHERSHLPRLKYLVFASALGWGAFGVVTGSWSQVAFSTAYAISAFWGARRDSRTRRAALGASDPSTPPNNQGD